MSATIAAATYLARYYGPEAVTAYSLPDVEGEAIDVHWAGGLATIHQVNSAVWRVNCALAYEDTTLLNLPGVVERMIATALANARTN